MRRYVLYFEGNPHVDGDRPRNEIVRRQLPGLPTVINLDNIVVFDTLNQHSLSIRRQFHSEMSAERKVSRLLVFATLQGYESSELLPRRRIV